MVAIAKVLNLHLNDLDVDSDFVYTDLDEEVWMEPTLGTEISSGCCLKLRNNLCGPKQAPRNWFQHIKEFIVSLGFKQTVLDKCLYI